jgi:hypothetical protein
MNTDRRRIDDHTEKIEKDGYMRNLDNKVRLLLPPGVISSKLLASLPVPRSCLRPSPTSRRKERRRFKTRDPAKRRGLSRSS